MNIWYFPLFFIIYSVLGWLLEVCFHLYKNKKLINRGFLHGPYCPIYGIGMVFIVIFLSPDTSSYIETFTKAIAITTVLELCTGVLLEKAFGVRWWDYSALPLNFDGYISVRFSIYWGILATAVMYLVQPAVSQLVADIFQHSWAILSIKAVIAVIAVDTGASLYLLAKTHINIKMFDNLKTHLKRNHYERRILKAYPNATSRKFSSFKEYQAKP